MSANEMKADRVDQCNCPRNMPYLDWSHDKDCPLYWPMSKRTTPMANKQMVPIPEDLKQRRIDVSNLRFYSLMFREHKWETDVIHWTVFVQTLDEIASRIENQEANLAHLESANKALSTVLERSITMIDAYYQGTCCCSDFYACDFCKEADGFIKEARAALEQAQRKG